MFIKIGCSIQISNIERDLEGRYIVVDIEENGEKVSCVALYAPNKDSPQFITKIQKEIKERNEKKILIGDFNVTLDVEMDRLNTYSNNEKTKSEIINVMNEYSLKDIWRIRYPQSRQYSWIKTNKNPDLQKASRIDYALISAGLDHKVDNCMYKSGILSDHRAFFIALNLNYIERGVGFWKFNNTLLYEEKFVKMMTEEIQNTLLSTVHKSAIDRWETIKLRIKKTATRYSRMKSNELKDTIAHLSEVINSLEDRLPLDQKESEMLQDTRNDLENLLEKRLNGVMFRSKARWFEKGEKSTKYFFALEKSRYNAKTCYAMYNKEGNLVDNPDEILEIQKQFYSDLYSKDEDVIFTLENHSDTVVSEEHRELQSHQLTLEELGIAAKSLNNDKTPGYDGISVDFYKFFWNMIKTPLYEMMLEVYENGLLHQSARTGILNLIPKTNKDTRYIKNLRPITLLNVDYKIIEKAVANKMMPALKDIIHRDQRGFMKDRRISVNIRKLLDIMEHVKRLDIEAIVLSLDFVKCFDKCSFSILHGSLEFFRFGSIVKEWTQILYNKFVVKVQNNGYFSSEIDINKGVHQGGCCSSLYFLVIAEILAMALRGNESIKGITIGQVNNLLNQFADDADVFSLNDEESIKAIFQELEDFRKQSGFTLSYDKTTLYRMGSLRHSSARLYNIDQVAWSNEDITVLGVTVAHEDIVEKNYNIIVDKVRKVLGSWENRGLTLLGKILVVNTLVASLFVYKMMVLPMMPSSILVKVEQEIKSYLWNGKTAKIAFDILKNPVCHGGLNLVDLKIKERALKATWPQILHQEEEYASVVYTFVEPNIRENIWRASLRPEHVEYLGIKNQFWKDVLIAWCEFNYWHNSHVDNQIIWYNSRILSSGKPFVWKKPLKKGLMYIHQLYKNGRFKTLCELKREYGIDTMQYNILNVSLPPYWKEQMEEITRCQFQPVSIHNYDRYKSTPHLSRFIYKTLHGDPLLVHNKLMKWNSLGYFNWSLEDYLSYFTNIRKITNHVKIRDFQYRLLQRGIITNIQLKKWGITDTNLCSFCNKYEETILHLFYQCEKVQEMWNEYKHYIFNEYRINPICSFENILSNHFCHPKKHVANAIGLYLKQYIYSKRCLKEDLVFRNFIYYLDSIRATEKYIAIKNGKARTHYIKWKMPDGDLTDFVFEHIDNIELDC